MKKLLHVCCANCLSDVVGELTKDGTVSSLRSAVLLFAPLVLAGETLHSERKPA